MGIEPERIKLVWASAAEGVQLAREITTFVEEIRALGPLRWPVRLAAIERQETAVAEEVAA
jgi:F420-non-reducing hydrogenase iron-sulfur subunit